MLEIYFDGVLLDPNNYMDLSQKWDMFDKEFKLGMTPSREINLTIPKSVFTNPEEIVIKYAGNDYAHLIVDKVSYDENGSIPKAKLTLVDKMVNANFNYDASQLVPCSIKTILEDICDKMGVELGTTTFTNEDLVVDYYDNTLLARDYLSFISELAGGFARIENPTTDAMALARKKLKRRSGVSLSRVADDLNIHYDIRAQGCSRLLSDLQGI